MVSGGKSVKNINVNIQQLVGEIKNVFEQGQEINFDMVREMMEKALITAVRDTEVTLASDA